MSKRITIDVAADGSVKIEGHGFVGAECDKAIKAFEDALGVTEKRQNKPEYNQRTVHGAQQRAGQ